MELEKMSVEEITGHINDWCGISVYDLAWPCIEELARRLALKDADLLLERDRAEKELAKAQEDLKWATGQHEESRSLVRDLTRVLERQNAKAEKAEAQVKMLVEVLYPNLAYLENLIDQHGHDSVLLREHPHPCNQHDFCFMRQAQKGADAIREALAKIKEES